MREAAERCREVAGGDADHGGVIEGLLSLNSTARTGGASNPSRIFMRGCLLIWVQLCVPGGETVTGWQRRTQMDAIILLAVAFFALAIAYAHGCDKM
jgi:hypothetical protein